jgi:hypothetical protein
MQGTISGEGWSTPMARPRSNDPIEPMTLQNMRHKGVRSVWVQCYQCRHEFSGSVTGGVAVNTAFLDFASEGKCRSAAAAMEAAERVAIGESRAGRPSISPPAYYRTIARCVER